MPAGKFLFPLSIEENCYTTMYICNTVKSKGDNDILDTIRNIVRFMLQNVIIVLILFGSNLINTIYR